MPFPNFVRPGPLPLSGGLPKPPKPAAMSLFTKPSTTTVVTNQKPPKPDGDEMRYFQPYLPPQLTAEPYKEGPHWFNWGQQNGSPSYLGGINDYLTSAGLLNAPTTTGGNSGGGYGSSGGGGGGEEAAPVTWSEFEYRPEGAPAWWKALKPSEATPSSEYLAMMNMMIPTLSPEDQRAVAANLYQQDPATFAHLNPEMLDKDAAPFKPPSQMTGELRQQYTSSGRASNALNALTQLAQAMGKADSDLGPGYRYLRSIINLGQQYGAQGQGNSMSRRNQMNYMGALDPLLSQAQQDSLSAYGPLARMLAQPYFSAGQLLPMQRTQDGRYMFGEPNKELF